MGENEKAKRLVEKARAAAGSVQAAMVPGLRDLLNALADYVAEKEGV